MGSDGGGRSGPCGACKYLRRKCPALCVFAPYFEPKHGTTHFSVVHKVFGAANVAKLLAGVPESRRREAMATICYEAQARVVDPVHGCVSHILALQQQVIASYIIYIYILVCVRACVCFAYCAKM